MSKIKNFCKSFRKFWSLENGGRLIALLGKVLKILKQAKQEENSIKI
jgi:hypothetical protein